MNASKLRVLIGWIAMILLVSACTFPDLSPPTPFSFPTPNLTMTALFQPTQTIPPSVTPPQVNTATSAPASPTPQETPTPTATDTDGGTAADRPGARIAAPYVETAPVIDGELDEWNQEEYGVNSVVYGAARVSSGADLGGTVMVAWDEDNLYIAARVTDDTYAQGDTGRYLYLGDSLEVLLDTNLSADRLVRSLSPDDYQLGVSPGSPEAGQAVEAYLWYPGSLEGGRSQVVIDAVETANGYQAEIAIPWEVFRVSPDGGEQYGFAFSISDNDLTGQDVQQSMASTAPDRDFTDPTTWGTLTLETP